MRDGETGRAHDDVVAFFGFEKVSDYIAALRFEGRRLLERVK